jgi:hypothetical protein
MTTTLETEVGSEPVVPPHQQFLNGAYGIIGRTVSTKFEPKHFK